MMVKRKLLSEYKVFRNEVSLVEYALWWAVRLALLFVLVKATRDAMSASLLLQLRVEFAASFIIPLLHILPRKLFVARLSYRMQDIILFMLAVTAIFGQYKGYYSTVEWYDAYLHIIGCFLFVFAGYWLIMALKHDKLPVSPVVAAMCGFGFSFFVAVGWEIFEFVCDTVMTGSNSQNWSCINSGRLLSLLPAMDPQRYALLDTMTDMIAGTIGSILGGIAVYPYVRHMNKKASKPALISINTHDNKRVNISKNENNRRLG